MPTRNNVSRCDHQTAPRATTGARVGLMTSAASSEERHVSYARGSRGAGRQLSDELPQRRDILRPASKPLFAAAGCLNLHPLSSNQSKIPESAQITLCSALRLPSLPVWPSTSYPPGSSVEEGTINISSSLKKQIPTWNPSRWPPPRGLPGLMVRSSPPSQRYSIYCLFHGLTSS